MWAGCILHAGHTHNLGRSSFHFVSLYLVIFQLYSGAPFKNEISIFFYCKGRSFSLPCLYSFTLLGCNSYSSLSVWVASSRLSSISSDFHGIYQRKEEFSEKRRWGIVKTQMTFTGQGSPGSENRQTAEEVFVCPQLKFWKIRKN